MKNNSLPNIILLATLSSSVISINYAYDETLIPSDNYHYQYENDITDWKDAALYSNADYQQPGTTDQKVKTMIEFSKAIIENSKDIDSEYVEIVNENFWDLI